MARMNLAETLFINSTVRVRQLRGDVGPRVFRYAQVAQPNRVLEVGCGQGVGLELILDRFPGVTALGIDLDPRMVRRARRRLNGRAEACVGDLTRLDFPEASFDVVVDFAAVHHVPDWKTALGEIARVLRPGGQFLFEDLDVTRHSWFARVFFPHPSERFTSQEFVGALGEVGIEVGDNLEDRNGHFVGAGRRAITSR